MENVAAGCGTGRQRRQVYCVEEEDANLRPVKDAMCIASGKISFMSRSGGRCKEFDKYSV